MSNVADVDSDDAFDAVRQKWANRVTQSPKARKAREKQIRATVDGRSLRATGRTAQFNFKCAPDIKALVHKAVEREGVTVAEWMERAMQAALGLDGEN